MAVSVFVDVHQNHHANSANWLQCVWCPCRSSLSISVWSFHHKVVLLQKLTVNGENRLPASIMTQGVHEIE